MVQRSAAMAFAAGAFVFPGGRVDPADEALAVRIGWPDHAAKITAIRECLEESAVAVGLTPCPAPDAAQALQDGLLAGRDFGEMLEEHGLELDLGALTPFARWRARPEVSRRFDTNFFIARAPDGEWQPRAAPGECVSAQWVGAGRMLKQEAAGAATLIFPTRKNLERLAQHDSFSSVLADAERHPVSPITATIEEVDGTEYIRIPEGLGYLVTREPLARSGRG